MTLVSFVLDAAAPRTKKNSSRIVRCGRFTKILPSEAHEEWFNSVLLEAKTRARKATAVNLPIDYPVNVRALFYRQALTGDAVGYYQALADLLESAQIVTNDKHVVSWDGSRLLKDAKRPRIEVWIERQ